MANNIKSSRRRDPAWKYANEVEMEEQATKKGYKYLSCKFCSKIIKGGVKRVKEHLTCTKKNMTKCSKVPDEVKKEILEYLRNFENTKTLTQMKFEEMVGNRSYYCSGAPGTTITTTMEVQEVQNQSTRGVRGPMDRYLGA